MKCSRCQNEDVQYFFENNGRIYCRKCIAFSTKTVNLKSVKNEKKIYYHLNYSLNLEQERTSKLLIERYQNHQNNDAVVKILFHDINLSLLIFLYKLKGDF
mgnify:CR=1 FL=1